MLQCQQRHRKATRKRKRPHSAIGARGLGSSPLGYDLRIAWHRAPRGACAPDPRAVRRPHLPHSFVAIKPSASPGVCLFRSMQKNPTIKINWRDAECSIAMGSEFAQRSALFQLDVLQDLQDAVGELLAVAFERMYPGLAEKERQAAIDIDPSTRLATLGLLRPGLATAAKLGFDHEASANSCKNQLLTPKGDRPPDASQAGSDSPSKRLSAL